MDTKAMEYILEISRQKSVTRAAEALNISQSALSQILLRVEKELGTPLFVRGKRAVKPTEAGRLYLDYARRMVEEKRRLLSEISSLSGAQRIRLGLTSKWGMLMMRDILPEFSRRYPDVLVELRQYNYRDLREEFQRYDIDIAVTTTLPGDMPPSGGVLLRSEEMLLIVSSRQPFTRAHRDEDTVPESVIATELGGLSIIRSAIGSVSRVLEDRMFERIGFVPHTFCELTDNTVFIRMVEADLGYAFISSDYRDELSDQVQAWHLDPPLLRGNVLMVSPGIKTGGAEKYLLSLIRSHRIFSLKEPG